MTNSIPSSRRRRSKKPGYIGVVILGALLLVFVVSFVRERIEENAAHNLQNPVPATAAALAAGKTNYDSKCASCHGSTGDGKGDKAQGLWKTPTDFRNEAQMDRRTDGDLYWVTTKGSWPMPGFEDKLAPLERWQLVDYIRTFAAQSGKPSP
ncbi:MAG TPA: cytochrome c [Candidatus Acidoferrales bacterium]|nr:cytochrome c [Candidatus Acidoferrales bacterium]